MTKKNCRFTQSRISDYLDNALEIAERQTVESHLLNCQDCEKEFKAQQKILARLQQQKAPEMPEPFWQAFPEQVLDAYKQQKAQTVRKHTFRHTWLENRSTRLWAAALASGLVLVIGMTVLLNRPSSWQATDTGNWVAQVRQSDKLASLARQHSIIHQQGNKLAFADSAMQYNFFTSANLYVEALVMASGGDKPGARQQLAYLQNTIPATRVPRVQRQISTLIEQLQGKPFTRRALLSEFAGLELSLQKYAQQTGQQAALFWQTGLTISRLGLAIYMRDIQALTQFNQLEMLQQQLGRAGVPPGVVDAMNKINLIIKQDVYTEKELTTLQEQVTRIQLIMG